MTATYGANPEDLDRLAGELKAFSDRLNGRCGQVTRQLHSSPWRGRRADEFRHNWNYTYSRELSAAAAYLAGAVDILHANANQQRQASGLEAVNYHKPSLLGDLMHDANKLVHDVDKVKHDADAVLHDVGKILHHGLNTIEKVAQSEVHDLAQSAKHDLNRLVNSQGFKDTMIGLDVAAAVMPFVTAAVIAIPVVGEIALGVNVAIQAAVLAGDAAQIANSGKFTVADAGKLAIDGAGLIVPGAKFAKLLPAGKDSVKVEKVVGDFAAGDAQNLFSLGKSLAKGTLGTDTADLSDAAKFIVGTRAANAAVSTVGESAQVYGDVRDNHYLQAATDLFGGTSIGFGAYGSGGDAASYFVSHSSDLTGAGGNALDIENRVLNPNQP